MYRHLRWAVLPVLLALVSSCDPAQNSVQNPPTAPLFSEEAITGHTLVQGQIPASAPELQVSEMIGPGGGSIHLEGHSLTVPEGAVTDLTVFTMTLQSDGYVGVELSAVGDIGNVGANGFANGKEVTLSLTYAWASNVNDPSKLRIVQLLDEGDVDPVESSEVQEAQKTVTAKLKHFSKYCLASG